MKKKLLFTLILLILLFGCGEKVTNNVQKQEDNTVVTVSKVNDLEDYIYFENYKKIMLDGLNNYILDIPIINLDSDNIKTVNLEIKSFVISCYNEYVINNDKLVRGKYITYEYYINDKYITLMIKYNMYNNGILDNDNYIIYNIDKNNGVLLDNKDLLKLFVIDENELPYLVRNNIESEDIEYTVTCMKENYYLYIDKDNKLHLLFFENTDDEQIKRDLIIS